MKEPEHEPTSCAKLILRTMRDSNNKWLLLFDITIKVVCYGTKVKQRWRETFQCEREWSRHAGIDGAMEILLESCVYLFENSCLCPSWNDSLDSLELFLLANLVHVRFLSLATKLIHVIWDKPKEIHMFRAHVVGVEVVRDEEEE